MTDNEMLEQLEDLIVDIKSFISSDSEMKEVFIKDIVALELIISKYKELKLNNTIEILEEEKRIPEKINDFTISVGRVDDSNTEEYIQKLFEQQYEVFNKINGIIDYLKSKGE